MIDEIAIEDIASGCAAYVMSQGLAIGRWWRENVGRAGFVPARFTYQACHVARAVPLLRQDSHVSDLLTIKELGVVTISNEERTLPNEESFYGLEGQTEILAFDETLPADRAGWEEWANQSGSGVNTDPDR